MAVVSGAQTPEPEQCSEFVRIEFKLLLQPGQLGWMLQQAQQQTTQGRRGGFVAGKQQQQKLQQPHFFYFSVLLLLEIPTHIELLIKNINKT